MKPFSILILLVGGLFSMVGAQNPTSELLENINTPSDETAPFQYGGRLYYTSAYRQHLGTNEVSRIYSTNGEGTGQFNINPKDATNSVSDLTLSSDAQRMYFTVCGRGGCTIWSRERNYEGDWQPAVKLPAIINRRKVNTKQPSVGYDQALGRNVLYFASDREGGMGGWDIWASVIEPDYEKGEISYGKPFPLAFNTPHDELTPFFHMASQTLFFSSDGLPGLGGLDIFSAKKNEDGTWEAPLNPGPALNSPADDQHYTFHTKLGKGFFASNRNPENGFDIFVVRPSALLQISAFDILEGTELTELVAEVFAEESGRSSVYLQQPFDASLSLHLLPGRTYRIALLAAGYSPQLLVYTTPEGNVPMTTEQEVHLFRDEDFLSGNREAPGQIFPSGAVQVLPVGKPAPKPSPNSLAEGLPF